MSMDDDAHGGSGSSPAARFPSFTERVQLRSAMIGLVLQLNRLAKQCALDTEVLAFRPRPIDVFIQRLAKISDKAERFAEAVSAERTEFESHYRDNRKLAIAMAWEVAYSIDNDDDRVAYEFACACLKAHRTAKGTDVLESLATRSGEPSKYVTSAKRRIARLAWKTGDLEQALLAMRSQRGRAAKTQYRTWLGISTVRNGLLIAESGDTESAGAVLTGGLSASGMDDDIAKAVAAIYLSAARKSSMAAVPEFASSAALDQLGSQGPRPIILSGFGWSGSGAVADFLTGHPHVADIFAGREMGLWTGKYGLDRLYAHFLARGFNRRLLLEFLTRHCFGHRFLGHSKGTKSLGGMWSWLDESQRWILLGALSRWLEDIHEWTERPDYPLLDAFQSLSSVFLRLLSDHETPCILLSNCIPSNAIVGIRMFKEPAVIVSWRDPGDAYASKVAAFPDIRLDLDGWKNQLKSRIDQYLAGKSKVTGHAGIWLDVSFEDFVRDAGQRHRMLELLNLNGQELESTFDPDVSAKNIGIFDVQAEKDSAAWRDLKRSVDEARLKAIALSGAATGEPEHTEENCL